MSNTISITINGKEHKVDADSVLGQLWTIWPGTDRSKEIHQVLNRITRRWKYGRGGEEPGDLVLNVSRVLNKLAKAKLPNKDSNDFDDYRKYYWWILELFLHEGLDYTKFIHHESSPNIFDFKDLVGTKTGDKIVNLNYKRPETNPELFRLGLNLKDEQFEPDEKGLISRYWEVASSHLANVKNRLFVYEYIEKGSLEYHPDHLLAYTQAHHKVFELIEKRISANKGLVYKRLFAVSTDRSADKKKQLEQFLAKCTVACFGHLIRCLTGSHKRRFTYNLSPSGFFLVPVSRHYHFALVDDSVILSEYYRYDKRGDCVPDILMAHSAIGPYKTLDMLYQNEFDTEDGNQKMRISSIKDIDDALQELSDSTEKRLTEISSPEQDPIYSEYINKKHSLDIKKQLLKEVMEKFSKKP